MPAHKGQISNPTGKGGFKKGQSGNPSGRSKKSRHIEELVQRATENKDGSNALIEALVSIALGKDPDAKPSDRTQAAKTLLAYGYGNPATKSNITVATSNKAAEEMTDAELAVIAGGAA